MSRQAVAPVAITGLGCLSAAGPTLSAGVAALFRKRRDPSPPGRFTTTHSIRYPVFEIPLDWLPDDLRGRDDLLLTARFALVAAREAVADAGLDPGLLPRLRAGVVMGTTVGSSMNNEDFYREFYSGGRPGMGAIERYLTSNPAAVVARAFGLEGPCQTVVNACSSGTDAVGIGASWIREGVCDLVLAGGADELCRAIYNGFISLMITDASPCRPFDRRRKGLNLGEGAGVLVLESEKLLSERGARPRAAVLGYGSACDAHHLTAPHPEGAGLRRAMARAMAEAGIGPAGLAFVNAHGTATQDNDKVENRVLHDLLPGVPFSSTKGHTGHTLGASGAIEAAFTVACLEEGKVPASAGFAEADPELPGRPVTVATPVTGVCALSDSLAFGGNNGVLVLGRSEP